MIIKLHNMINIGKLLARKKTCLSSRQSFQHLFVLANLHLKFERLPNIYYLLLTTQTSLTLQGTLLAESFLLEQNKND